MRRREDVTLNPRSMRSLSLLAALAALAAAISVSHAPSRVRESRIVERRTSDTTVSIHTFQFAPDTLRVKVGTRVVWTNADEIEHTITSGAPDTRDGPFNGVVPRSGATYSALVTTAGTYRYFCDRHRFMNGTVIVTP
jgi:plastocyanin